MSSDAVVSGSDNNADVGADRRCAFHSTMYAVLRPSIRTFCPDATTWAPGFKSLIVSDLRDSHRALVRSP
jgi:hypothetical protein